MIVPERIPNLLARQVFVVLVVDERPIADQSRDKLRCVNDSVSEEPIHFRRTNGAIENRHILDVPGKGILKRGKVSAPDGDD
jgi:hypothetical protein